MNHTSFRLAMRFAVPVIALSALALTGQRVDALVSPHDHLAQAQTLQLSQEDCAQDAGSSGLVEDAAQRERRAFHLRWALTLPALPQLPGVSILR